MTTTGARAAAPASAPGLRMPRLTRRVMVDLRIWMIGFGLLIGLAFPFAVVGLGVSSAQVMRPAFFAATLVAGIVVAELNHALARAVVGGRLRPMTAAMRRVEGAITEATYTGNWASCDPRSCLVPVDSDDELGYLAVSFNRLVEGLAASHRVAGDVAAVSEALAAHLELDRLAASTLNELVDRVGCSAAALLSVSNGRVTLAGSIGLTYPGGLAESEAVGRVVRTGRPVAVALPQDVVVTTGVVDVVPRHVRVVPLRSGVATVGVLLVAWLEPPSRAVIGVLEASLPGLGVAVNNALNHQDLQRVAALDPLTGVYNRRFGLQRLTEEFGRSARSGDPLGILMMDLDRFKDVNDTYGHLVGDRVLQTVVRAARHVLREGDVLVRYGGEEFLLVLPGAGGADIVATAERIRRAVAETDIVEGGQRISVTVSIGGAGLPHPLSESPADLIRLADRAVYDAKAGGRDRCVIA